MQENFLFHRLDQGQRTSETSLASLLDDWGGDSERWLFVSPHDDDVVIGAGLAIQAAVAEDIEVQVTIVTDGSMGYCSEEQRDSISSIRSEETSASMKTLGLKQEHLHFLGFPDCNLGRAAGRRRAEGGAVPYASHGFEGTQNSFTALIRGIRPSRVFLPTPTDLHPDHRVVHSEMLISLFHAQGEIWPELGKPVEEIPGVYEYATYSDYPEPPQIKIESSGEVFERKLEAIAAYVSQRQIAAVVEGIRQSGPVEYIRQVNFQFYRPSHYENLFKEAVRV